MEVNADLQECIEACRTCGVYYLTTSNFLRNIFAGAMEVAEMPMIRMELSAWNVEVKENDGYPQYICTGCVLEFQKVFKFRRLCTELQNQWRHFYNVRIDMTKIKTEKSDPADEEEAIHDFIYVDDLSDDDDVDGENSKYKATTPFHITHVPMQEVMESATVPGDEAFAAKVKVEPMDRGYPEKAAEASDGEKEFVEEPTRDEDTTVTASETESRCDEPAPQNDNLKDRQCNLCNKKFKGVSLDRWRFHMKWHRMKRRNIKCSKCAFNCISQKALRDHQRAAHSKSKCVNCEKLIPTKRMKSHLKECSLNDEPVEEWPCQYCCTVSSSESEWQQHCRDNHATDESSIQCDSDDAQSGELVDEDDAETEEDEQELLIVCAHCDSTFTTAIDLGAHVRATHQKDLSNTDKLDDAAKNGLDDEDEIDDDEEFVEDRSGLSQTTEEDEEEEAEAYVDITDANGNNASDLIYTECFRCSSCTCSFDSVEQLKAHVAVHTKKSAFECEVCGKTFDLKFSLNRHLKKHIK